MACCLSCFEQHLASGQNFSYNLENPGRSYCDCVERMAHFDQVLPDRVRRVLCEALHQWRHCEPWLGSLKETLGLGLDDFPIQ